MLQELFRIPGLDLPIYSYGLMMVIGFLCAIQLAKYLATRGGLDPEVFINAGLLALVTGILGARLSHVIENLPQYTNVTPTRSVWDNFFDAINIRSGGLTYYGGFLLAFPTLVFYAIKKRVPLRLGMDIVAPCIVLGLGFGRIGCFLNGCCYGDTCDLPIAVHYPYRSVPYEEEFLRGQLPSSPATLAQLVKTNPDGSLRLLALKEMDADQRELATNERSLGLHPAQLYSAFTAFLIAGILLSYFTLPHAVGRGFAMMLMLEGATRFILELLRVEPPVIGDFSLSMLLGIGLAVLGVILWIIFGELAGREKEPLGFRITSGAAAA